MGNSVPEIKNVEDSQLQLNAGEINVQETCKYVKCIPNKEKFDNEYDNNEYWLVILIMLLIIFIFIMSLILKKVI